MRTRSLLKDPFLPLALVALWLLVVKPEWLSTGLPGAFFTVVATLAVAMALLGLLVVAARHLVQYAIPTRTGALILLVEAVVLAGCVLYADPSRTNWVLLGGVAPALALLMFGLGVLYRRGSSSRTA